MNSSLQHLASVWAAVITASATFRAPAKAETVKSTDELDHPDKTYTGTVTAVDPAGQVMKVKNWTMFHKTFNLGQSCAFILPDNVTGTLDNLRCGEKVAVSYQKVHGVLIADRIKQIPVRFEGKVAAIDPIAQQIIVHQRGLDKPMVIAADCKIVRLNHQPGSLPDIRPGDHVTVTYEMPDDTPTAREIAQTSIEFEGILTAIDTVDKTVKASSGFTSKKFVIGNHCAIVLEGRPHARLNDLKPDERLTFSYDEINGVNVVNRIGTPAPSTVSAAYTVPPTGF